MNFQPAGSVGGENYEWSCKEGNHIYDATRACDTGLLTSPIIEYTHSAGNCSVTGGYRYRGSGFPQLYGIYLYADFCTGRLWGATPNGLGGWTSTQHFDAPFTISSFGEDEAGNLYLADYSNGKIYEITMSSSPNSPPLGFLDLPTQNASVGGTVGVYAWAIDQQTPSGSLSLTLLVDGSPVSAPLTRFGRPDVCAVYPEGTYPGSCTSGIRFDWTTTGLSESHTVAIRVTDGGGLIRVLGPWTVTVGP